MNRIVLSFLWRGQDRVVKMINFYENRGLRVLDFETLVKYLRLSWFKSLYDSENAGWKCYLSHLLKPFGGLFLFHCDYDPKNYNTSNCVVLLAFPIRVDRFSQPNFHQFFFRFGRGITP